MSPLLTLFRLAEDEPVAVLPPAVVGNLPLRIDNRAFADFNNAVTGPKSRRTRRLDKVHVCPLILMIVDVVGYFTQQNAFRL
jgi:hypothetical protein